MNPPLRHFEPPPASFPHGLRDHAPAAPLARRGWLTLAALLLLCVLPRALMAWRLDYVCSDGLYYISAAKALDAGQSAGGDGSTIYPLALVGLHRAGLDWDIAGRLWGVVAATLVVCPLFGWIRRRFDSRLAVLTCLLYACHPNLIEWSPEPVRDPTFWLLFFSAVYLSWRAVTEGRAGLAVLAGLTVAAAAQVRFEGWFLLLPLAVWTSVRLHNRAAWRRLALAALLCVVAAPTSLLLLAWAESRQPGDAAGGPWEHLSMARRWLASLALSPDDPNSAWSSLTAPTPPSSGPQPAPVEVNRMRKGRLWIFLHKLEQGIEPFYLLLMLGGLWGWRRTLFQTDQAAMLAASLAILAGMWIVLWNSRQLNGRYVFTVLILGLPYAALGLLALTSRLVGWIDRLTVRPWPKAALPYALLLALGVLGASDALSSEYPVRRQAAELGMWIDRRFPDDREVVFCCARHVAYYATGSCVEVHPTQLRAAILERQPRVVVVNLNTLDEYRSQELQALIGEMRFEQLPRECLPPGNEGTVVLVRGATRNAVQDAQREEEKTLR